MAAPDCPHGTSLPVGVCLMGDLQDTHSEWVTDVVRASGLGLSAQGLEVHLFADGNDVDDMFTGPKPETACINGFYLDGVVAAIPGSLAHELAHVAIEGRGDAVAVTSTDSVELYDAYTLQHTPEYGWHDEDQMRVNYIVYKHQPPPDVGAGKRCVVEGSIADGG